MLPLSDELENLIRKTVSTPEFWKVNYYMRSMKKAPHGGVFRIDYPNMFLKYYSVPTYLFFTPNAEIPIPVTNVIVKFRPMINASNVTMEELLRYCLNVDLNDRNNPSDGARMYIATCGKIITPIHHKRNGSMRTVYDAIEGKINYLDNFEIDENRLVLLFVFTLIERFAYRIHDLKEIIDQEIHELPTDKYGLCDITDGTYYPERDTFEV